MDDLAAPQARQAEAIEKSPLPATPGHGIE
jgi:hypothetical protein